MRDCNQEILERPGKNIVLLPKFSCHTLRHTFATRLCEAGVNMKAIQDILGHADIGTTMNIYAEATEELKKQGAETYSNYMAEQDKKEQKEANDMVVDVKILKPEKPDNEAG